MQVCPGTKGAVSTAIAVQPPSSGATVALRLRLVAVSNGRVGLGDVRTGDELRGTKYEDHLFALCTYTKSSMKFYDVCAKWKEV